MQGLFEGCIEAAVICGLRESSQAVALRQKMPNRTFLGIAVLRPGRDFFNTAVAPTAPSGGFIHLADRDAGRGSWHFFDQNRVLAHMGNAFIASIFIAKFA
jgi:hypothetical protein